MAKKQERKFSPDQERTYWQEQRERYPRGQF